jgi:nickel superoxide dismutase
MKPFTLVTFVMLAFTSALTYSHCQIPCGIYDDPMRIKMMLEDAKTVEKSMNEIKKLEKKQDAQSTNQMVRWVINKENHADKIIGILTDYFLTQRIKSTDKTYVEQLKQLEIIVKLCVKAKQQVDLSIASQLTSAIKAFGKHYPEPEHKH